jgi:hypothetical protein
MNFINSAMDRTTKFHVRPTFLMACIGFLVILVLPDAIKGRYAVQQSFLIFAGLAVGTGWFFLLKYRKPNSKWRASIALVTSVYLTAFVPVFLFELSPIKWLMRHPHHYVFEMYARPWVHWGYQGYLPLLLSVVGSSLGRGWARMAFIMASVLLLVLRASMGTWVY